jgi:hypothetical protein
MLMGLGYLARIIDFLSGRFSSHRINTHKRNIQSLRKFLLVRVAMFLVGAASPNLAYAQLQRNTQQLDHQEIVSGDSPSAEDSFPIDNPRNQTIPVSEAKTIYLAACRAVEQEFARTDPIRPRLKLLIGSETDRVYFPKREIQLKKWDKYKFAQGVVMLAADALLSQDKKISLTRLAVSEAESTVDIRDLKSSPPLLRPTSNSMR